MSRVYWATRDVAAELRGTERHWLRWLAMSPGMHAWNLDLMPHEEQLNKIISMVPGYELNYVRDALDRSGGRWHGLREVADMLRTALQVEGFTLEIDDVQLNSMNVTLNTALVLGSDVIALAAKIHGYCEGHAYVAYEDREWVASVVNRGLRDGVYRVDMGWDDVVALLLDVEGHPGPVVTSFSITDDFPNATIADFDGTQDEWYALEDDERWAAGVAGLTRSPWLRIGPNSRDWATEWSFDELVTPYDLLAPDCEARVREAHARYVQRLKEVNKSK